MTTPRPLHPFAGVDVPALLVERGRQRRAHPLLIWAPPDGPERVWSYAAFVDEVARVAGGLARRGIGPGDRVLIHMENCPESLIARFACCWLGAVGVLTNPAVAGQELAHLAGAANVRAAVTHPRLAELVVEHSPRLDWIAVTETDAGTPVTAPARGDSWAALAADPLPRREPDPDAPAAIMYTTGTTSLPKGVLWTHANMLWGGKLGALQQGFRADDVMHIVLPMFHVVGFSWSFLPTLFVGATALVQPRFSARNYWPAALKHGATLGAQVPFITGVLAQQDIPEHNFRQWTVGSFEPENAARFRVAHMSGWGMTEMVAMAMTDDPWSDQWPCSMGRRPRAIAYSSKTTTATRLARARPERSSWVPADGAARPGHDSARRAQPGSRLPVPNYGRNGARSIQDHVRQPPTPQTPEEATAPYIQDHVHQLPTPQTPEEAPARRRIDYPDV